MSWRSSFRLPPLLITLYVVAAGCLVTIEDVRRPLPVLDGAPPESDGGPVDPPSPQQPTNLAVGQSHPFDIALDDRYVYWTEDGGVVRARKQRSDTEPWYYDVYKTKGPLGLAVDTGFVFVADGALSQITKVSKDSKTIVKLASVDRPQAIALDDKNVYFTGNLLGIVGVVAKTGGPVRELARSTGMTSGALWGLAIDADFVYWTDNKTKTVARVSKGGGPATILATRTTDEVHGIGVDATTLYWREGDNGKGALVSMPKAGGSVTVLQSKNQQFPRGIAVDSSGVYWTGGFPTTSRVDRLGLDGQLYRSLATGQPSAHSIVVDTGFVYWTNWNGGTIMRVAKGP